MPKDIDLYVATLQGEGNGKKFVSAWNLHKGSAANAAEGTQLHKNINSPKRELIADILAVSDALRKAPEKSHIIVHTDTQELVDLINTRDIVPILQDSYQRRDKPLSQAAHSFLDALAHHNHVKAEMTPVEDETLTNTYLRAAQIIEKMNEGECIYQAEKKAKKKPEPRPSQSNLRAMAFREQHEEKSLQREVDEDYEAHPIHYDFAA